MEEVHTLHEVSVKIALYSSNFKKVALMHYPGRSIYGLPGGHLEENELPDEALTRELEEELGIEGVIFDKTSFFLRDGRGSLVILAYTGIAQEGLVLNSPEPEKEIGIWMDQDEFQLTTNISDQYKEFVITNWPTN